MNHAQIESISAKSVTDKYDTDFPAILDMEIIRRNALDAIASNERIQAYAQFEIYALSKETLTDKEIKELIGFKPPRNGYKYERYKFIRYSSIHVVGKNGKLEKQLTWLIEKIDPIAENQARQEAKEKNKRKRLEQIGILNLEILSLEDFGVDEGVENYYNMKKVISEL